jgi:hypothetical protein
MAKKEVPGRMAQMTKPRTPNSEARQQLGRLLDALAKEALDTPDEAFFAELTSENFSFDEMARAAEDAIAQGITDHDAGKPADRRAAHKTVKRGRIASRLASKEPSLKARIITAARIELDMMSENDVDGLLGDLREFGIMDEDAS